MPIDIERATESLRQYAPIPWAQIPDLGLYMDQVVTLIGRIYAPLFGDDVRRCLTPSMINNYVKAKLIPRPAGKKYGREQLALLIMIVTLKQSASMEAIGRMLALKEGESVEQLYDAFCRRLSAALRGVPTGDAFRETPASALDFAILASACSAASAAVLAAEAEAPHSPDAPA